MKSTRSYHGQKPISHEFGRKSVSKRANEWSQRSTAEQATKAGSLEQANVWAVQADERARSEWPSAQRVNFIAICLVWSGDWSERQQCLRRVWASDDAEDDGRWRQAQNGRTKRKKKSKMDKKRRAKWAGKERKGDSKMDLKTENKAKQKQTKNKEKEKKEKCSKIRMQHRRRKSRIEIWKQYGTETRTAGFKRCDYLVVTNSFPFIFRFRWMDRPTDRHFDVIF